MQISYLAYIKHNIDQGIVPEPEMVAALKDSVLLHTNHGSKNPSTEVIHFSSEYKSKWDLCELFPGVCVCVRVCVCVCVMRAGACMYMYIKTYSKNVQAFLRRRIAIV